MTRLDNLDNKICSRVVLKDKILTDILPGLTMSKMQELLGLININFQHQI